MIGMNTVAAVAGFLVGKVLEFTGYVANQPRTETALMGFGHC